ncbi:response regulator transcription factor [Streptomyces sp. NBC_01320]|uniref:response regulator transcription factor n=1 Tax=Streptomyces sp. NBC_01320 TaxID=2903824 RepID=UPI002E12B744|nr:response regulator transcription factor [Streptomyces sp. NBC_01320]
MPGNTTPTAPAPGLPDLRPAAARIGRLSERERQVMTLLATGGTNQAIARRLGVSEGTVKAHVGRILLKLGLESRTAAAVVAVSILGPCRCDAGAPCETIPKASALRP